MAALFIDRVFTYDKCNCWPKEPGLSNESVENLVHKFLKAVSVGFKVILQMLVPVIDLRCKHFATCIHVPTKYVNM